MAHEMDKYIGNKIRQRRECLGITQSQVAKHLGITFQQVQKYENGANRTSGSKLWEISFLLRVEPSYFFPERDGTTKVEEFSRQEYILIGAFRKVNDSVRHSIIDLLCGIGE